MNDFTVFQSNWTITLQITWNIGNWKWASSFSNFQILKFSNSCTNTSNHYTSYSSLPGLRGCFICLDFLFMPLRPEIKMRWNVKCCVNSFQLWWNAYGMGSPGHLRFLLWFLDCQFYFMAIGIKLFLMHPEDGYW